MMTSGMERFNRDFWNAYFPKPGAVFRGTFAPGFAFRNMKHQGAIPESQQGALGREPETAGRAGQAVEGPRVCAVPLVVLMALGHGSATARIRLNASAADIEKSSCPSSGLRLEIG